MDRVDFALENDFYSLSLLHTYTLLPSFLFHLHRSERERERDSNSECVILSHVMFRQPRVVTIES
jgi:hypothetical protein